MKRVEKREREYLERIFYTMIKTGSLFPILLGGGGEYQIRVAQMSIPETPLPTYSIIVAKRDMKRMSVTLIISSVITIGNSGGFEVRSFKSIGGLKTVREVIKQIKKR